MKRVRRLSLTVTRREISISVTQTTRASDASLSAPPHPSDQAEAIPPANCPDCGAPWSADFAGVLKDFAIPLQQLRAALLDRRLHSFWLPEGQFLVCEQSLRTLTLKTPGEIDP